MTTLDDYAKTGIEAINEQKYAEAIEAFQQALAIDDSRPDLNNALGMAHMYRGEVHSAVPHLERAVQLAAPYDHPEHQEMKRSFHQALSTAYAMSDRVPDAIRTLQSAIEKWPDVRDARLQLAQLLVESCRLDEGVEAFKALADFEGLDAEMREAAGAVAGAIGAFQESENEGGIFLQGHQESYKSYFDEVVAEQEANGWYAEAARMSKTDDGELKPVIAEGARPYAMMRVDLVNPADGTESSVYSEQEPMVVALKGLEPLGQLPVMLPWKGHPFAVWVCSRCPWHWLQLTVQFEEVGDAESDIGAVDPLIADWYLAGYNGDFGDKDSGRFHYVTDPEAVGDRAVSYIFDLGRARFESIESLLHRLTILHDKRQIRRVLFGQGRLPD